MKRHLQCAEQQASPSNLTKCCACHVKWLSWLMSATYETSFPMRGATSITLQPHQILRLPRKIAFQNLSEILRERLKRQFQCAADSSMIRTWSEHDPTMNSSSRTRPFAEVTFRASKTHFVLKITTFRAPAIYPDFTEYCACHEKWHSKITKSCTCHEKWFSWLISVTYETSFTMRGATRPTLQPHQILRLPRKMALMIDLRHIWNVIYNARSNRHHPPTSPNTAPATQKCTPRSKRNSPRTVEASIPMRGRFDHDPNMIRPWTRHLAPARSPRLLFALRRRILYWKLQHFALRLSTQISPNTVPATKNDTPTSPNAAPATKSDTPRSPNTAPATKSSTPRSPNAAPATKSQLLLSCYSTELLLNCYSTELLLNCYWTELLLNCYWTELNLLLNCAVTELLLKWAVTELLLNWAEPVTQVSCYWTVTQLSCYWTVTQLSWTCYSTELLLNCYSSELLLNCYSTELLLNCYSSELLLNWAVIAFLKLRNSEVSHLNFLWSIVFVYCWPNWCTNFMPEQRESVCKKIWEPFCPTTKQTGRRVSRKPLTRKLKCLKSCKKDDKTSVNQRTPKKDFSSQQYHGQPSKGWETTMWNFN